MKLRLRYELTSAAEPEFFSIVTEDCHRTFGLIADACISAYRVFDHCIQSSPYAYALSMRVSWRTMQVSVSGGETSADSNQCVAEGISSDHTQLLALSLTGRCVLFQR
jgi:hypothetical protein